MLDGFESKLTSSKWAALAKCSQDTAQRDIADLLAKGVLIKSAASGRATSYAVVGISQKTLLDIEQGRSMGTVQTTVRVWLAACRGGVVWFLVFCWGLLAYIKP